MDQVLGAIAFVAVANGTRQQPQLVPPRSREAVAEDLERREDHLWGHLGVGLLDVGLKLRAAHDWLAAPP